MTCRIIMLRMTWHLEHIKRKDMEGHWSVQLQQHCELPLFFQRKKNLPVSLVQVQQNLQFFKILYYEIRITTPWLIIIIEYWAYGMFYDAFHWTIGFVIPVFFVMVKVHHKYIKNNVYYTKCWLSCPLPALFESIFLMALAALFQHLIHVINL